MARSELDWCIMHWVHTNISESTSDILFLFISIVKGISTWRSWLCLEVKVLILLEMVLAPLPQVML